MALVLLVAPYEQEVNLLKLIAFRKLDSHLISLPPPASSLSVHNNVISRFFGVADVGHERFEILEGLCVLERLKLFFCYQESRARCLMHAISPLVSGLATSFAPARRHLRLFQTLLNRSLELLPQPQTLEGSSQCSKICMTALTYAYLVLDEFVVRKYFLVEAQQPCPGLCVRHQTLTGRLHIDW